MCGLRATSQGRAVSRHFLLLHPAPCTRFPSWHFLVASVWTQGWFGSISLPSVGNCLCLEHTGAQGAWLPLGSGPWLPEGTEQRGGKGEPSCHNPGQLTGSREGQGLALSPGSQGYGLLLHSCPWVGGGQEKALDTTAKAEGEGGQLGQSQGGKSDSSSMRSGDQSRKPP